MRTHEKIIRSIKENPLPTVLQIFSVLIVILNLFIASKLAPVVTDIRTINVEVQAIQKAIEKNDEDHKNLVSKSELNLVKDALDKINIRLDQLIGVLLK